MVIVPLCLRDVVHVLVMYGHIAASLSLYGVRNAKRLNHVGAQIMLCPLPCFIVFHSSSFSPSTFLEMSLPVFSQQASVFVGKPIKTNSYM